MEVGQVNDAERIENKMRGSCIMTGSHCRICGNSQGKNVLIVPSLPSPRMQGSVVLDRMSSRPQLKTPQIVVACSEIEWESREPGKRKRIITNNVHQSLPVAMASTTPRAAKLAILSHDNTRGFPALPNELYSEILSHLPQTLTGNLFFLTWPKHAAR